MSAPTCLHCGSPVPENARFCPACGRLAPAPVIPDPAPSKRCPRCGTSTFTTARICVQCGHSFEKPKRSWAFVFSCTGIFGAITLCACFALVILYFAPSSELAQDEQLAELPANVTPIAGIKLGQLAPNFVLGNSSGRQDSLQQLHGKPVILNFWASWCGPCRNEMADLNALYQEETTRSGLVVLAINTGDTNRASAESFIKDKQLRFTILWDEKNQVGKQYNVRAFPTSFFIDRQGIIRAIRIGSMSRQDMNTRARLIQ